MKRLNKAQAEPVNTAAMPLPKVFAWLNRFAPALEKRGVQFDQLRLILATKIYWPLANQVAWAVFSVSVSAVKMPA